MHARKTRERKKQQSTTLQTRIGELQDEVNLMSLNRISLYHEVKRFFHNLHVSYSTEMELFIELAFHQH